MWAQLEGQIQLEKSKALDSKSNGGAENSVKLLEDHARVVLLGFEACMGRVFPVDHPIIGVADSQCSRYVD